jgi:hypothetical protein
MQTDLPRPLARRALGLIVAVVTVTACAAGQPGASQPERPTTTLAPDQAVPPTDAPVTGEVPTELLDRILADAAERANVDADAIAVIRGESVTWSDGSLGCPEPDQAYTMALVDGYHVVVEAGDGELDYRATADGTFIVCANPGPSRPGG